MFDGVTVLKRQSMGGLWFQVIAGFASGQDPGAEATNVAPIGVSNVSIDILRLGDAAIQAVGAVASRPRDPEVFAGSLVEIVGFEARPREAFERTIAIVERRATLREPHEPDPAGTRKPSRLILNVHDACAHVAASPVMNEGYVARQEKLA